MDSNGIRNWLLCTPRPHSVRIVDVEKKEHNFVVTEGITWRAAAESILALQPEQLEALGPKGEFLRAIRPREVEDDEEEAIEVVTDSETQRFVVVAKLLGDAYRHSTSTAFDKMTSMFDAVNRRAETLEKSLETMERMMRKQWEAQILADAQEASGGAGGPITMEGLIAAFMQGQAQKAADAATKTVANGASTTAPKEGEHG